MIIFLVFYYVFFFNINFREIKDFVIIKILRKSMGEFIIFLRRIEIFKVIEEIFGGYDYLKIKLLINLEDK